MTIINKCKQRKQTRNCHSTLSKWYGLSECVWMRIPEPSNRFYAFVWCLFGPIQCLISRLCLSIMVLVLARHTFVATSGCMMAAACFLLLAACCYCSVANSQVVRKFEIRKFHCFQNFPALFVQENTKNLFLCVPLQEGGDFVFFSFPWFCLWKFCTIFESPKVRKSEIPIAVHWWLTLAVGFLFFNFRKVRLKVF